MFARLMPRDDRFFELFNAHAENIVAGARELAAAMTTSRSLDEHVRRIDEVERNADKVTHETILLLHRSFITPLDRDQIHQLITSMDDILDLMQDVAESMMLYDIRRVTPEAASLADICQRSCERVKTAVRLLTDLKQSDAILKTCEEIDVLESDADRVMRSALSKLFRDESDAKEIIKLRSVYELLELITDRCEDVANIIEGIVIEHS
jgi:predicted phosphate transport protein (TIGR00153 family)